VQELHGLDASIEDELKKNGRLLSRAVLFPRTSATTQLTQHFCLTLMQLLRTLHFLV